MKAGAVLILTVLLPVHRSLSDMTKKPKWYYTDPTGKCGTIYDPKHDPEVTCWHCKKTFLCDPMDACCRLCGAPFAKERCAEFGFVPKTKKKKSAEPIWITRDREKIPVSQMRDGHLLRAHRMIKNQLVDYESTMDFAASPLAPQGEIASMDFEEYLDHSMMAGAAARYWEPILMKEIKKRNLSPLACKEFKPLPKFKQIAPGMYERIDKG